MKELRPSKIIIMADYEDAYAWDQEDVCIGLGYNFPDIAEVQEIEKEREDWATWFGQAEANDPDFPWDKFRA
ncbi:MAG: hypothetical protein NTW49_15100 [Bacteroidia bacterium]|nr:hypothetical protein [Bacteroidia bacterium]